MDNSDCELYTTLVRYHDAQVVAISHVCVSLSEDRGWQSGFHHLCGEVWDVNTSCSSLGWLT